MNNSTTLTLDDKRIYPLGENTLFLLRQDQKIYGLIVDKEIDNETLINQGKELIRPFQLENFSPDDIAAESCLWAMLTDCLKALGLPNLDTLLQRSRDNRGGLLQISSDFIELGRWQGIQPPQDWREGQAVLMLLDALLSLNDTERLIEIIKKAIRQLPDPIDLGEKENLQVPYLCHSQAKEIGSLIPVNLAEPVGRALNSLEQKVGNLDDYVARELQMPVEELKERLYAEQIDAIALKHQAFEQGKFIIIGDQTGGGKMISAVGSTIRWCLRHNHRFILVTASDRLYAQTVKDLKIVGLSPEDVNIFITNRNFKTQLNENTTLKSPTNGDTIMKNAIHRGELKGYDGIFTTYSQLQTVNGNRKLRHRFLQAMAQDAILIFDESHLAGGSASRERYTNSLVLTSARAVFARELEDVAKAGVFASATAFKNPIAVTLYYRTDLSEAFKDSDTNSVEAIAEAIQGGGVPLMQVLPINLSEAGQYIRRERSFAGSTFTVENVPVNRDIAEAVYEVMADILAFDREKFIALDEIKQSIENDAAKICIDNAVGIEGADSVSFSSLVHNVIEQFHLTIKVDNACEFIKNRVLQGEKVAIALENTMQSPIERYIEDHDLRIGDKISANFGDILRYYLRRTRRITIDALEMDNNVPKRVKRYYWLEDSDLTPEGYTLYQNTLAKIDSIDWTKLHISPIDRLHYKLREAGIVTDEITGRSFKLNFQNDSDGTISIRQQKTEDKVRAVDRFNWGSTQVLIINKSACEGINLHHPKKRSMVIIQALRDINNFVQVLGRVKRIGEPSPPKYCLLYSDLPTEKRPAALLCAKMAQLNASTLASRERSGINLNLAIDIFNHYGDTVVAELLTILPELNEELGNPYKKSIEGLARRATGRIPLLGSIEKQEWFYELLETRYRQFIQEKIINGESILEAQFQDFAAVSKGRYAIEKGEDETNPFKSTIWAERLDCAFVSRAYNSEEVVWELASRLDCSLPDTWECESTLKILQKEGQEYIAQKLKHFDKLADFYKARFDHPDYTAYRNRYDANCDLIREIITQIYPGAVVKLTNPPIEDTDVTFGIVLAIKNQQSDNTNPAVPSNWVLEVAIAHPSQRLRIPFSQLLVSPQEESSEKINLTIESEIGTTLMLFDWAKNQEGRYERIMLTGNLLKAWQHDIRSKGKGRVIRYSTAEKETKVGILLSLDFNIDFYLSNQALSVEDTDLALLYLQKRNAQLYSGDDNLKVTLSEENILTLTVPSRSDTGGIYYKDAEIAKIAHSDFVKRGQLYCCEVDQSARFKPLLGYLIKTHKLFGTAHTLNSL